MHPHGDLTGLIKFLARDEWKSSFEEVMGEHFGPAMQAFDLEYEAIGAALGGRPSPGAFQTLRALQSPAALLCQSTAT